MEITIDTGALRGARDGDVIAFKGIPYAKPPVGPLRWRPAERPEPWSGVRDATEFGDICPQPAPLEGTGAFGVPACLRAQSEDCLTLNVWTPAERTGALPVMVWLHGGAHTFGSSSLPYYDGMSFARDGIVFVTINYRLGTLGYFAHPALTAEAAPNAPLANYGLMDQIAALEWVQRNIAEFGGDPKNVTVFGESAGGSSTLYLMSLPSAQGLFQKAIVESGGGWMAPASLPAKEALGIQTISDAGLDGARATAADLRAIPVEKLVARPKGPGFGPFIDGRLVTESPTKTFAEGRAARIPLIIGTNSDEGSLIDIFKLPPSFVFATFPPGAQDDMRRLYAGEAKDDGVLSHRLYTDGIFGAPARWVARTAAAHGAPTWLYYFSYVLELQKQAVLGARHGSEIPFVFDNWDKIPLAAEFVTEPDMTVAARMHACWVAFAKSGRPAYPGGPDWPAVTATNESTMEFGDDVGLRKNFRKMQLDFQETHSLLFRAAMP